jgi:hypothetical protein
LRAAIFCKDFEVRTIFISAAALLCAPSVLAAKDPVQLAPSSPWNLHYGDTSCQLIRTFGEADKATTFVLERVAPRSNLTMLVFGGSLRSKTGENDARAVFIPLTGNVLEGGHVAETVTTKKQTAILWSRVNFRTKPDPFKAPREGKRDDRDLVQEAADRAEESASAAVITAVKIREAGRHEVVLQTGPLARPIAMMRECANEQLEQWGVNPAVEDKIVRLPVPTQTIAGLFSSMDYPKGALREGDESTIQARLNIGADGAVTKCTGLSRFKAPGFDALVCRKLDRVRFKPAELADGTKVPSYYLVSIRFVLPS